MSGNSTDPATALTQQVGQLEISGAAVPPAAAPSAAATPAAPAASSASPSASASSPDQWEDITSRLRHATAHLLQRGQLLHHSSFSLKESMSALELGDPKMDSAMHVHNVVSFESALASGRLVPPSALTPRHVLSLIDELFACEVSVYTGGSIAHTLYTCFYLHRLGLVLRECPLLGSYLLFQLKTLELVRSIILAGDIFLDEDFYYSLSGIKLGQMEVGQNFTNASSTAIPPTDATNSNGANSQKEDPLYGGMDVLQIVQLFDEQCTLIDQKIKEARQKEQATGKITPPEQLQQPLNDESSDLHVWTLLKNRFSFRKSWYFLHLHLREPPFILRRTLANVQGFESDITEALSTMQRTMQGSCEREQEEVRRKEEEEYHKNVDALLASYASNPTSAPPSIPEKPQPHLSPRALESMGFDPNLTKCLVLSAPPRDAHVLYKRDAVAVVQDMMQHMSLWKQLPLLAATPHAFHALLGWFEHFHRQQPNLLIRSHLWLYMTRGGKGVQEPSAEMFTFLQEPTATPPPSSASASAPPPSTSAAIPVDGIWDTKELLIRSHAKMCSSIERLAAETLAEEARFKRSKQAPPQPDAATAPMTYSFFLTRTLTPFLNYFKILLEHPSMLRKHFLHASDPNATFILDWNILMTDARAVDLQHWAPRFLEAEAAAVVIPPGLSPSLRGSHPQLYYHHNCHALIMQRITRIMSLYLMAGLESSLYGAREVQVVLFYLEYAIDAHVQNRNMSYRNPKELLALQKKEQQHAKKKGGKPEKKLSLPSVTPPPSPPPVDYESLLLEAQRFLCRGLIQLVEGLRRCKMSKKQAAGSETQVAAILVPSIDDDLVQTWHAHRFADLHLIPYPPPLSYDHYRAQMADFDRNPHFTPESIVSMGQKSLQLAKETLSLLHSRFGNTDAFVPSVHQPFPICNQEAEYVRGLLKVTVSNILTAITYKKNIQQAQEANKPCKLTYRWEPQTGAAYQPALPARVLHFPIVQLV